MIAGASNLCAMDKGKKGTAGTSDPYCVLFCDERGRKPKSARFGQTDTLRKTLSPAWNALFALDVGRAHSRVVFEVIRLSVVAGEE